MIESLVSGQILNNHYHQSWEIEDLKQEFAKRQIVRLPDLFQPHVLTVLQDEVASASSSLNFRMRDNRI